MEKKLDQYQQDLPEKLIQKVADAILKERDLITFEYVSTVDKNGKHIFPWCCREEFARRLAIVALKVFGEFEKATSAADNRMIGGAVPPSPTNLQE